MSTRAARLHHGLALGLGLRVVSARLRSLGGGSHLAVGALDWVRVLGVVLTRLHLGFMHVWILTLSRVFLIECKMLLGLILGSHWLVLLLHVVSQLRLVLTLLRVLAEVEMRVGQILVRVVIILPDQLYYLFSIAIQVGIVLHVPRLFDFLAGSEFLLIQELYVVHIDGMWIDPVNLGGRLGSFCLIAWLLFGP